jgi:hypothetical protein
MGRGGFQVRMNRWWALGIFAALVAAAYAVALWPTNGSAPAPPASALPLPASVRLLVARQGGSEIDTAYDHHQYRYLALAGPPDWSPTKLMVTEVRYLTAHGWDGTYAATYSNTPPPNGVVTNPPPAPFTTPGASVLINGPSRIYAGLDPVHGLTQAEQAFDGTPIYNATPILDALKRRQPILSVMLAAGRHSPPG